MNIKLNKKQIRKNKKVSPKRVRKSKLETLLENKLAKGGSLGVEVERCEFCEEEYVDCRC